MESGSAPLRFFIFSAPSITKIASNRLTIWQGRVLCSTFGANEDFTHDLVTDATRIVGEFDFAVYEFWDDFFAEGIVLDACFDYDAMSFSTWWDRFLTNCAFIHCSFFVF